MNGYSAKLPLVYNASTGPYQMLTELKSVVSQNLKMLILTAPGERVMDSFYGVGARNYLFSNDFPQTASDLRLRINQQISTYMDDVMEVVSVTIQQDQQFDHVINLDIQYFIKNYNVFDNLTLLIK